jgi:hypothetical protein
MALQKIHNETYTTTCKKELLQEWPSIDDAIASGAMLCFFLKNWSIRSKYSKSTGASPVPQSPWLSFFDV